MMKTFGVLLALYIGITSAFGQADEAPIKEKDIKYKDWTYAKIGGGASVNLRKFAKDKKLVLVVYFAPWCHNSKHQAPVIQGLYEKYSAQGLGIIGIGEYGAEEDIKFYVDFYRLTFPVVYGSSSKDDRLITLHYEYRTGLGDTRKWGTPLNIFLDPKNLSEKDETLINKAPIAEGELNSSEAENFIREKLGLKPIENKTVSTNKPVEVCDDSAPDFKKP